MVVDLHSWQDGEFLVNRPAGTSKPPASCGGGMDGPGVLLPSTCLEGESGWRSAMCSPSLGVRQRGTMKSHEQHGATVLDRGKDYDSFKWIRIDQIYRGNINYIEVSFDWKIRRK